jgi:hypothetical protein
VTFKEWKTQLLATFTPMEGDVIGTLRFYDPSTDRSVSQPVRSARQMADLRGYLPRLLWMTK